MEEQKCWRCGLISCIPRRQPGEDDARYAVRVVLWLAAETKEAWWLIDGYAAALDRGCSPYEAAVEAICDFESGWSFQAA